MGGSRYGSDPSRAFSLIAYDTVKESIEQAVNRGFMREHDGDGTEVTLQQEKGGSVWQQL
jgi:ABC-type sulfate transport system substrate-binding protein